MGLDQPLRRDASCAALRDTLRCEYSASVNRELSLCFVFRLLLNWYCLARTARVRAQHAKCGVSVLASNRDAFARTGEARAKRWVADLLV